MSDLISFDSGSASDPVYEGATSQELYYIVQVNLLVVARLQIDDLLDTSEKIYKIQRPSQTMLTAHRSNGRSRLCLFVAAAKASLAEQELKRRSSLSLSLAAHESNR